MQSLKVRHGAPATLQKEKDGKTAENVELLLYFPSSSPETKSVATMQGLVSYCLEVTVCEKVLTLNTVRTSVISHKTGIIVRCRVLQDTAKADLMRKSNGIWMLLDAILPLPNTSK